MNKIKKCPKCGFILTDNNYCIKCGYYKGKSISNIDKYENEIDDLQFLLKDEYVKIVHNENLGLLFILGPLYFSYYHCIFSSIIGIILEFSISWILGMSHGGSNIIIMCFLLFNRIIHIFFGNTILLKILKIYTTKLKTKKGCQYKETLYNKGAKSPLYLMLAISIYIMILVLWLMIYKKYW